jgi:hypothetical protein
MSSTNPLSYFKDRSFQGGTIVVDIRHLQALMGTYGHMIPTKVPTSCPITTHKNSNVRSTSNVVGGIISGLN